MFMSVIAKFKTGKIRGDSLLASRFFIFRDAWLETNAPRFHTIVQHEQCQSDQPCCSVAEDAFDGDDTGAGGTGLDVIFTKLSELETEITDEQTVEKERMDTFNAKCNKEISDHSGIITLTTKTRQDLKSQTAASNLVVGCCQLHRTHFFHSSHTSATDSTPVDCK